VALTDNPFTTLTVVVAPAILTNASSVLSLGTGNRIARVIDRTRAITAELAHLDPSSAKAVGYARQLGRLRARAQMLLRALRFFYTSIGSFAAAALISVVGSVLTVTANVPVFDAMAILALVAGTVGVIGLVVGCTVMVHETRLAVRFLEEEANLLVPAATASR
jgi:hypothetical protein